MLKREIFSGFYKESWPPRNLSDHQKHAHEHLVAPTKAKNSIEKMHGIRYSCLLQLPYWDPVKFSAVDPMHNLFLGTAKHLMHVWFHQNMITKNCG